MDLNDYKKQELNDIDQKIYKNLHHTCDSYLLACKNYDLMLELVNDCKAQKAATESLIKQYLNVMKTDHVLIVLNNVKYCIETKPKFIVRKE